MSVCLHMIVKDESEIIKRCLRSVLPHVDAATIVDTGSTDGTQAIVDAILADWGKMSLRVDRPWRGFAESRTEGMALARDMCPGDDWLLFTLDADETAEVEPGFSWPDPSEADSWHVWVDLLGVRFTRAMLTRASVPWRYEGEIHEDIVVDQEYRGGMVRGLLVRSTRDGARAKDPVHYLRDATLLLAAHERNPEDPRTVFYLANSYRDAGDYEAAMRWYDHRAAMRGWDQETWATMHERARCMILLGRAPKDVLEAHLLAYGNRPSRAETLRQLAYYLRGIGASDAADLFDVEADRKAVPGDLLFVDTKAYVADVRIGVITAPRPDGAFPLAATLTSVMATDTVGADTIRVFSDSIGAVRIPPMIAQEHNDEAGLLKLASGGIYGTLNLVRALEWAAGAEALSVVLEDDVLCSRNWVARTRALLAKAERNGPAVLSLHHMFGQLDGVLVDAGIGVGDDRLMAPGAGAFPNGSQGYAMRPGTAKMLAGVLRNRMGAETVEERKVWAMDVGVFRFCVELGVARLLYTHPCLLWHQDSAASTWASGDERWLGDDAAHRKLRVTRHFRPW